MTEKRCVCVDTYMVGANSDRKRELQFNVTNTMRGTQRTHRKDTESNFGNQNHDVQVMS